MTLQPARETIEPFFQDLIPAYKDYCRTVSRRAMALSIETCAYAWWLCDAVQAAAVADLGSGFTSYVLRLYAHRADYPVTVASVDDNPEWLAKTGEFLTRWDLPATGLHGPEWRDMPDRYDVIVHDYSSGEVREEWMTVAVEHLTPGGVIVFDDAQHFGHHLAAAAAVRDHGLSLFDVVEQTIDEVGRHAVMAHR